MTVPLLEVRNLKKSFPVKEGLLMRAKHFNQAVNDVSLFIQPGETQGCIGCHDNRGDAPGYPGSQMPLAFKR